MTTSRRFVPYVALGLLAVAPLAAAEDPPAPTPVRVPAPLPSPVPPAPVAAPPPAPAPPPISPAPPTGTVLTLTRADALRYAAARNLELLAGSIDPVIACERITAADGFFDTLLTAGFRGGREETPTNFSFSGTNVTRDDVLVADAALSRRLRSGDRVAVVFHADRLLTNNASSSVNPRWIHSASVEYVKPLLRGAGGVVTADVRRAENGARAADHAFAALLDVVLLRVEAAYWNLAFADEDVRSRLEAESVAGELEAVTKARYDAQLATPIDLAEARAGVESRRGERVTAQGQRAAAEDALRALLLPFDGSGPPVSIRVTDDPRRIGADEALPTYEERRYVEMALRRRGDLLAASAELDSRDVDVEVARDELRPALDLVVRLSTDGIGRGYVDGLEETLAGQGTSATVGLDFSMYLGRRTAMANLCIAQWARAQAGIRRREIENRAAVDVRAALRDYATARTLVTVAQAEMVAGREALAGERARERNGESTPFRVLEKQEALTNAITREGRAAATVRIALARLWQSVGMLAEVRRITPPSAPGEGR